MDEAYYKKQLDIKDRAAKKEKEADEEISFGAFKRRAGRFFSGKANTKEQENIALGVGFPLLFGGGIGSIAGSLAGSFVGKGFGGQILGGGIGQLFDQLVVQSAELGKAFRALAENANGLRAVGAKVTAEEAARISDLKAAGQYNAADQLTRQQLRDQLGYGPIAEINAIGVDTNAAAVETLSSAWKELTSTLGGVVGLLVGPLIFALAGIIKVAQALISVL